MKRINERETQFLEFVEIYVGILMDNGWLDNSPLTINHNDTNIQDVWYEGTTGLYELLFMINPTTYTENDNKKYIEIVLTTNL